MPDSDDDNNDGVEEMPNPMGQVGMGVKKCKSLLDQLSLVSSSTSLMST